jgi:hypothetical protein
MRDSIYKFRALGNPTDTLLKFNTNCKADKKGELKREIQILKFFKDLTPNCNGQN